MLYLYRMLLVDSTITETDSDIPILSIDTDYWWGRVKGSEEDSEEERDGIVSQSLVSPTVFFSMCSIQRPRESLDSDELSSLPSQMRYHIREDKKRRANFDSREVITKSYSSVHIPNYFFWFFHEKIRETISPGTCKCLLCRSDHSVRFGAGRPLHPSRQLHHDA